jgi:predicted MPP superfamily phosphohydrolase
MKRGQINFLVFLIMALLVLTIFMFTIDSRKASTTAETISTPEETPEEQLKLGCLIDSPFYCKVWTTSVENNELVLQIESSKGESYILQEIILQDCQRKREESIALLQGSAKTIKFICPLKTDTFFYSEIKINYKLERGGPNKIAEGNLAEKIP